ncbi:hypothetical protein FNF27_08258 [Cafeteria roenbergensis]|uniref:Uncharacterized protein n=1 Tax=Cafeteria roenbergensis TaxID=33653 RepID=A0A5A8D712_CAFRO|nr:hypothetical protein FNF27_08258 [Cafeteria roenbergensis]
MPLQPWSRASPETFATKRSAEKTDAADAAGGTAVTGSAAEIMSRARFYAITRAKARGTRGSGSGGVAN